jgi:poly(3-hydroxybutyrate) depolymerase
MRRLGILALLVACSGPSTQPDGADNVAGVHQHVLAGTGIDREVLVYVPEKAVGVRAPVVVGIHGTSGTGENFANTSGWREVVDREGVIAVFPTAAVHCYRDDKNFDGDVTDAGELEVATKWAAGRLGTPAQPLCVGYDLASLTAEQRALVNHPLQDDVAFFDSIVALLQEQYLVDSKRMYITGFSNGAQMSARLGLERANVFAAGAAAGGPVGVTPQATRPMTFVVTVGENDEKFTPALGVSSLSMQESLLMQYPAVKAAFVTPYLTGFGLADSYTYSTPMLGSATLSRFVYSTSTVGASNQLQFVVIGGIGHAYPAQLPEALWTIFSAESL